MDRAPALGTPHGARITTLLALEEGVLHTFAFPRQEAIPAVLAPVPASFNTVVLLHLAHNGVQVEVL